MGLLDIFSNVAETKERHKKRELETRYYKTSYRKVKDVILQFAKNETLSIRNVDDTHGELYLQATRYHLIVQIVQVTPLETALDVKVQTYTIMGFHRPKKHILKLYSYADEHLPFKGVSLNP